MTTTIWTVFTDMRLASIVIYIFSIPILLTGISQLNISWTMDLINLIFYSFGLFVCLLGIYSYSKMMTRHLLPIAGSYILVSVYGVSQAFYLLSILYKTKDEQISDCVEDDDGDNARSWDECNEEIDKNIILYTVLAILLFITVACCDILLTRFIMDFRKNPQAYLSRGIWWNKESPLDDEERGLQRTTPTRTFTSCSINAPPPVYTSMSNDEDVVDQKTVDSNSCSIPLEKVKKMP